MPGAGFQFAIDHTELKVNFFLAHLNKLCNERQRN